MNQLPTLFISHGAPDLPIREGAAIDFLKSLHQYFPKPRAILVISAHWNSAEPTVSKAIQPRTIPVLWDKHSGKIVNNESRQIIQMFDCLGTLREREFGDDANNTEFYPADLQPEIDRVMDEIYQPINNGVYRSGFATSQAAYTEAVTELFAALEYWETVLGKQSYLCGDRLTLADWCLFTTLFRFDLAYYGLFKCNIKRLVDFPNLWNYCRKLYQYADVRSVCNVEHVKQLYYAGLPELNPSRIVPIGPDLNLDLPLDRV